MSEDPDRPTSDYWDGISGHYLDWDGTPISMRRWGELYQQERHVGATFVGEVWVSTVWLGIDHQWGDGPPLIYESMVFRRKNVEADGFLGDELDMERYSTEEQARRGHDEMVKKWAAHAVLPELEEGDDGE